MPPQEVLDVVDDVIGQLTAVVAPVICSVTGDREEYHELIGVGDGGYHHGFGCQDVT
jgi:hypothetical protein